MSRFKRLCLATAAVALSTGALSLGAFAADQQTADQLQSQLRTMLSQWGSPLADKVTVKLDDDTYAVAIPLENWKGEDGTTPASATATAKPVGTGQWTLDQLTFPSPATIMGPGADGKPVDQVAFSIKEQTSSLTFDPSASFITGENILLTGILFSDVKRGSPEQHIGSMSVQGGVTPTTPDHGTLDGSAELKDVAFTGKDDKGAQTDVTIGDVKVAGHMANVTRARIAQIFGGLRQLGSMPQAPAGGQPTPAQKAAMRAVIEALNGIADSGSVSYSIDKINASGTQPFGVDHVAFGLAAAAPGGLLKLTLDFGIDGITVPGLPDSMKAYIPSHVQIRPYLTGVSAADVTRVAALALGDQGPEAATGPAMEAAFAHGGLKIGLEALAIDLGPAKLSGVGEVTLTQPDPSAIAGEVKVTGKGIDELLKQVQGDPQAAQIVPLLVFARGLAKPQPDGSLFWDVVYDAKGLGVNGVTVMPPMGGGGAPGGGAPK
jgi:hypothetical protein